MIRQLEKKFYTKVDTTLKPFENHENYNCQITFDDGTQYLIYANWMRNNDLHNWKGWHCEAGATRILIDKNLNIWSGECENDRLGNVQEGWNLLPEHSTCRRDHCTGCTDDLLTAKWKP